MTTTTQIRLITTGSPTPDALNALLRCAADVRGGEGVRAGVLSAREAASAMLGVVKHIVHTYGELRMRNACARLASAASIKYMTAGGVHEDVLVTCIAQGLLGIAGEANVRAALAFWATEHDPAVWLALVA